MGIYLKDGLILVGADGKIATDAACCCDTGACCHCDGTCVDAANETGGGVKVFCTAIAGRAEIVIQDEGHGISNPANLFVPFFTTKRGGSGIGLVLSRQIAEAHNGSLSLKNRTDKSGCEARLTLPLKQS